MTVLTGLHIYSFSQFIAALEYYCHAHQIGYKKGTENVWKVYMYSFLKLYWSHKQPYAARHTEYNKMYNNNIYITYIL